MNSQNDSILDVQGIIKDFGGLRAINHVSLQIREGEVRGLIGPNASGKTTLINLISGMYKVDDGHIYLNGKRIDGLEPDQIASRGVMRTFQISRICRSKPPWRKSRTAPDLNLGYPE